MSKSFDLSSILVLAGFLLSKLALCELLRGKNLRFTMVSDFDKLSCKINFLEVEQISGCHLFVEVLFVSVELVEIRIEKVTVVIVHLNLIEN